MFSHLLLLLSFAFPPIFALSIIPTHDFLDQQCWHEHPLSTVQIYSLSDGSLEYAVPLPSMINDRDWRYYRPWSRRPVCTDYIENLKNRLCIYTSTTFNFGRGISIFTTPKLASEFIGLPAFLTPEALKSRDINVHPGTWQTAAIPGKGIGVIASKPLDFKDHVTAHTPAFMAYLESDLGMLERESWWRLAVERLPEKIREEFLGLSYIFGDERIRVQDITKANTFQIDVAGVTHLAVFPETSRLNHACNPNAQYVIRNDLLTHYVHVTRPIAEGEEITIAYTSPLDHHAIRQQHLQQGFHFTCTCPRCAAGSSSDHVLDTIKNLQNQLNNWSSTSTGSPELAEQLMQLYRDEGLEGFMDVAYGFAASAYNAVGDSEKASHYAQKATEAILMKDGIWSPNLQLWNELLEDPGQHWSYRQRV